MKAGVPSLLLVDDDPIDMQAIRRSLRVLRIDNPVIEARDGVEALQHLRGENGHDRVPSPRLVLLDLNMPRMGGMEFLEEVRRDSGLRPTLVFVMTTSASEDDKARAYARNVAGYVLKQQPGRPFLETIRTLERYWRTLEFPV